MAKTIIKETINRLPLPGKCECRNALQTAIVTAGELIPAEQKERLKPILGKYLI